MRGFLSLLSFFVAGVLIAQEDVSAPVVDVAEETIPTLELMTVPIELVNQSWFVDRPGTAVIHFPDVVEEPESLPYGVNGLSFINVDVQATPDDPKGKSVAIVRFVFRATGLITIPTLEFTSETHLFQSVPQQILVNEAVRSEAMELTLKPEKLQVYVSEPLRLDISWQCNLEAGRLQALNYYPSFFNDSNVEIVIPRSTEPESEQVGLPLGGRRVIATRTLIDPDSKALGTVELPLYVRLKEPGMYTLPATRLECAYLAEGNRNFGQYAAHFNNSLFAPEEVTSRYQRFFVETPPIEIEVLPLPANGRLAEFSGLFTPVRMEVAVKPESMKVGELMQAEIKVFADAPHGMLELPLLSLQRSLRGRFLVDDELGRRWREDGSTFTCRLRPLTTGVNAFPTLHVQAFDAERGDYVMVATDPVALTVAQADGQDFMDLNSYKGAEVILSKQSAGVWHNQEANWMNDVMNTIVVLLATWFWLWLILGLGGFALLVPVVRERRRRALDARYRARAEAYAAFSNMPENDPSKWEAFLQFLAVSSGAGGKAWTVRDSQATLQELGARTEDIKTVLALHASVDAQDYSVAHPSAQCKALNSIAKRVLHLIGKAAVVVLLALGFMPSQSQASDWSQAEQVFEQALQAQAGSDAAAALYTDAALKFEAAAIAGDRPGIAWYNAGNAWFKTGALGRAIVAYRQAQMYRPFDSMVADNLSAARALTLNEVLDDQPWWLNWPAQWIQALLLVLLFVLGALLLVYLRYRGRYLFMACVVVGILNLCTIGVLVIATQQSGKRGVVIVDSVFARKGPGYAYTNAFNEPLHDGVEFTIDEVREGWALVRLTDGRQCWLPLSQAQLIL